MSKQRKPNHRRTPTPKRGPLNQPAKTFVVMRYEVRPPDGMSGGWTLRESPPMDEGQAWMLFDATEAEIAAMPNAPIRDPYLVRVEVFETRITERAVVEPGETDPVRQAAIDSSVAISERAHEMSQQ